MPRFHRTTSRLGLTALALLTLLIAACAVPPSETRGPAGAWAGRPMGSAPGANASLRRAIIAAAEREWQYFGRQTVVFKGAEESIPHVGDWEDDDSRLSSRVNVYWRAADRPGLDGMDCSKPWSAAFISWIMQSAGVPESQFQRAPAHWMYLADMIDNASLPGRYFVPRRIDAYSPEPGDLICAYRPPSYVRTFDGYVTASMLRGVHGHCDLVVAKTGQTLEAIGGNVRNSVSKSSFELDAQGKLKSVPRRPWLLILQNRL